MLEDMGGVAEHKHTARDTGIDQLRDVIERALGEEASREVQLKYLAIFVEEDIKSIATLQLLSAIDLYRIGLSMGHAKALVNT